MSYCEKGGEACTASCVDSMSEGEEGTPETFLIDLDSSCSWFSGAILGVSAFFIRLVVSLCARRRAFSDLGAPLEVYRMALYHYRLTLVFHSRLIVVVRSRQTQAFGRCLCNVHAWA